MRASVKMLIKTPAFTKKSGISIEEGNQKYFPKYQSIINGIFPEFTYQESRTHYRLSGAQFRGAGLYYEYA
jgi:hypothetical protein